MARLAVFGAVLAFVSLSHTSTQHSSGTVVVDNGRVGVGLITGGNFGPQSFSIGGSPGGGPETQVYVNEDEEKSDQDMVLQPPMNHKEPNNFEGFNSGNTQLYPVKSLTNTKPGKGGHGGKKGSEGDQILIGVVVQNSNKDIKDINKGNGNKQPAGLDAAAIEAIFGSNEGNTGLPSTKKGSSNTGKDGNILIDAVTAGNFEDGSLNINNNRKPETNVLQKGSGVNNENTRNTNAGNEAQDFIDAKSNSAGNTRVDSNDGQTNSGYNSHSYDERWIWNR